jgi:N-acetylglucosamine-6-phosphate deacetylase
MTLIAGAGVVADGCSPDEAGWVEIDGAHIVGVGTGGRPGAQGVGDAVLVPGFIDLQINGAGAVDFAHADRDAWRRALQAQARHGTTACCPTLVSAPLMTYDEPLAVARAVASGTVRGSDDELGARVLGVHL